MPQIFNDQVDSTCLHSMSIFMESQFPGKMKKTKNGKSHIHLLDCAIICFIITLEFHFHQLAKKNSPNQRTRNRLLSTQSTAKIGVNSQDETSETTRFHCFRAISPCLFPDNKRTWSPTPGAVHALNLTRQPAAARQLVPRGILKFVAVVWSYFVCVLKNGDPHEK